MRKFKYTRNRPRISFDEISAFEQNPDFGEYNLKLPNSYKNFLVQHGDGGSPKKNIFWDEAKELELGVSFFYAIQAGGNPLKEKIKNVYEDQVIPIGLMPFASDGGSGHYVFSMKNEDFEHIYIIYLDNMIPIKLCESFEEFIDKLEEE